MTFGLEHKGKSDPISGIDAEMNIPEQTEMLYGALKAPSKLLHDLDLSRLPVV